MLNLVTVNAYSQYSTFHSKPQKFGVIRWRFALLECFLILYIKLFETISEQCYKNERLSYNDYNGY